MAVRVVLRSMTQEIFQVYLGEHEVEYARDRMITDLESFDHALGVTRAQHQALLPQGLNTSGHYFFTIDYEEEGKPVGYVWYACKSQNEDLFLYHIFVHPTERRRGYASSALRIVSEHAKKLGRGAIWLNVMAHNPDAIAFYQSQGYKIATMHMCKHGIGRPDKE